MITITVCLLYVFSLERCSAEPPISRKYLPPPTAKYLPPKPPSTAYGVPGTLPPSTPPTQEDLESVIIDAPAFKKNNVWRNNGGYPPKMPPPQYGLPPVPIQQEDDESIVIDAPSFRRESRLVGGNVYRGGGVVGRLKDGPLSVSAGRSPDSSLTHFPVPSYSTTDPLNRSRGDQNYARTSQHTPPARSAPSPYFNNTGSYHERTGSTPYQFQNEKAAPKRVPNSNTGVLVNTRYNQGSLIQGRNLYNNPNGQRGNPLFNTYNTFGADFNTNEHRSSFLNDNQKTDVKVISNHDKHGNRRDVANFDKPTNSGTCGVVN